MSRDFRVSVVLRRALRFLTESGEVAVAIHYDAPWMPANGASDAL